MAYVTTAQWARYKKVLDDAAASFNKKVIIWKPLQSSLDRYSEDAPSESTYGTINLECLVNYNVFRTWPLTKETESGAIDKENIVVLFNIEYLKRLGYTDANDNFKFKPDDDYFILDGQRYTSAGDTKVAQASDKEILLQIIMRRDTTQTSETKY